MEINIKNIVWVASYPKSGNTWVRAILAEALFHSSKLNDLGKLIPSFPALNQMYNQNNKFVDYNTLIASWTETQRKLSFESKDKKNILKTHNACIKFNGIQFPDTNFTFKIIYIIRDPRDVLISLSHHGNKSFLEIEQDMLNQEYKTIRKDSPFHREFLSTWENHVDSWLMFDIKPLIIRYEDILNGTRQEILKIFDWLGINASDRVEEIIEKTSFENLQSQERKYGFDEKRGKNLFFRNGKTNSWKNENFDFSRIEIKFKRTMEKFNYV